MVDNQNSGAKLKKQQTTQDILDTALNRRNRGRESVDTSSSTSDSASKKKFARIEENTFYKIIFSDAEPEIKKDAVAKELAYDLSKDKSDNKESLAEFELFKEWLMDQRKDMAQQIIKLTDTDAFSELKDVFDEMNQGLLDFENQMSPLTDILDAVYSLRMAADGMMFDVFKEIQEDKKEEERIALLREDQNKRMDSYERDVAKFQKNIASLEQEKSWFGLGGIKKSALLKIEEQRQQINTTKKGMEILTDEIKSTVPNRSSEFAEFATEKAKLRELLDISSDEHKARQQALVDSANNFVNTADTRTSNVLEHLEGINGQIDKLSDSNSGLRNVYAIISEAVEDAESVNTKVRDSLLEDNSDESNIAKMKRENNKMAVEDHVTALTSAKVDTMGTQ